MSSQSYPLVILHYHLLQVKYRIDDASLREGKFRIDENTGTLFTRIGFEEDVGLSYSLTVSKLASSSFP